MHETYTRIATALLSGLIFFGAYWYSLIAFCIVLMIAFLAILVREWPLLSAGLPCSFTLLYPLLPMLSLLYLVIHFYYICPLLSIYAFAAAWLADTGGYAVGKLFGRHRMCPGISPGKTWEGFIGSTLCVVLCNTMLYMIGALSAVGIASFFFCAVFSCALALVALIGDLWISWLKRRVHCKDTGNWLPGHGGLLDRFDSVFFVAPFLLVWVGIARLSFC